MYRAIIVEDEKPILELMKVIIGRNGNFEIVGAFSSPLDALEQFPSLEADIAFVDIEMPKMSGLELAQRILEVSKRTAIVFSTAYEQYALSAFDVQALDYVLKPVTPAAIERVTSRLRVRLPQAAPTERLARQPVIRCFGSFELRNADGTLLRWPTRKSEELLAYFLCYPDRDINKWLLTDLLWPEMTEERAMPNLHTAIYLLKKMMKENGLPLDIQKTKEGYILALGDADYDYLAYLKNEVALSNGTLGTEQAEALRDLYRGPLLEGKTYLWKIPLEEKLEKQYTGLTRRLIEADLERSQWERAEGRLNAYLSIYPLNEEMNEKAIGMYESLGLNERAAKHYAKFEQAFREETGYAPSLKRE